MAPLSGIPFPYQADSMPALPASLTSTWVGDNYRSYAIDGTVQKVKQLIDIAVRFRDDRKVPIFCGEFGVYIPNSKNHHRVYWYEVVRKYLEEKKIAWTSWDYHGGFGLFESGSNGFFEHDLNVQLLEALGLDVPDQTDYVLLPDSTGSFIYSDYPGEQMFESSYNDGIVNYYSEDLPNNGRYCLKWSGANQYNTIGLDYQPDRDFSFLAKNSYALDLMVRGDTPGLSFQIRFIDTKTQSATDYPWRMGIKIDESKASWDRRWHHLYLPLSTFSDLGSWYSGWHNPAGLFDWKAVDRIEIVTEYGQLGSGIFWFDNIHLTNRDTAQVNQTGVYSGIGEDYARTGPLNFICYPNPVYGFLTVDSPSEDALSIELIDIQGKTVLSSQFRKHTRWDMSRLNAGLYFVRITDNQRNFITRRICKIDG
jgi:endoglucanase